MQITLAEDRTLHLPADEFQVTNSLATILTLGTEGGKLEPAEFCARFQKYAGLRYEELEKEIETKMLKDGPEIANKKDMMETQSDEDSDPGAEERKEMVKCLIGLQQIAFTQLREPRENCRVREINPLRVAQLAMAMKEKRQTSLSSNLTVMMVGPDAVIIDGNHRYQAMKNIRETVNERAFDTIPCLVYKEMTSQQVLATGYSRNSEAAAVYRMTDFDTIELLRKMLAVYAKGDPGDILAKLQGILGLGLGKVTTDEEKKKQVRHLSF